MSAPFIYVMGPSGAGTDSVLARARALIPSDLPVAFAHRYITRPADAGGENHVALSEAEFERHQRSACSSSTGRRMAFATASASRRTRGVAPAW